MKTVTSSQHKISRRRCQAICCGWEEWGCCQRCVMPAKVMPGVQSSPSMSSLLWLADEWHRSINEFWDKSHKMIAGCQAQPQPNPVIFITKCEVLMNKFQKHICTFTLTDFNPVYCFTVYCFTLLGLSPSLLGGWISKIPGPVRYWTCQDTGLAMSLGVLTSSQLQRYLALQL